MPIGGCPAAWTPTFGEIPGVEQGVNASCTFDDGSGPALFIGGAFTVAGGVPANRVAKWDGTHFSALGDGVTGPGSLVNVASLAVFDDGGGPALYAGGIFQTAGGVPASNIAKWNGSQWAPLGSGTGGAVSALVVFDDGAGPALYAAGFFAGAGGVNASNIAKWNGSTWSAVGSNGTNNTISALCVHNDGTGTALYAGGSFTSAGGVSAARIARWNGTIWSSLGSGMNSSVLSLATFDEGSGTALFAGGFFSLAGGTAAPHIARWTGSSWSSVGAAGTDGDVLTMRVLDDGSGESLFAGGSFTHAGGASANRIAKWNGSTWSALGTGLGAVYLTQTATVRALSPFDDGGGIAIFVGGLFHSAGGVPVSHVARWSSAGWSALLSGGITDEVDALEVFDDGSGPALIAGGSFTGLGGVSANGVARWNGTGWTALGSGVSAFTFPRVYALAVFDDGSGAALYVAGSFSGAGGIPVNNIARWNGSSWSALGAGVNSTIYGLATYDDGTGPALYATGSFSIAGTVGVSNIARWNGSTWSAVGTGLGGGSPVGYALTVFDSGSGPALYVGGHFSLAGGVTVGNVAKWNGSAWSTLGSGVGGTSTDSVRSLCVHDGGSGAALYAGGVFSLAGGFSANNIAKWSGTAWSALGLGVGGSNPLVLAMRSHDDGSGSALYAGGFIATAGGTAVNSVAKWNNSTWSAVGSGVLGPPKAINDYDDGIGHGLFVGGAFATCLDSGDGYLAKWGYPPSCYQPGMEICEPGVAGVVACPCSNPPAGFGQGCDNSSLTGGALLTAGGIARIASDSLVFTSMGEPAGAMSVLIQGTLSGVPGAHYGQGVRCIAGDLRRLYVKTAVGGAITAPEAADPTVSARSANLGIPIVQGTHRYYGVYYRDLVVLGGCPATSTFNITQQLRVLWHQ